jgi:hypothetical protein
MLSEVLHGFELMSSLNADKATFVSAVVDHVLPNVRLLKSFLVAHHNQEVLGSCYSHIQSSFIQQETKTFFDHALEVTSDAVENDDVFFTSLESIDSVNFDCFVEVATLVGAELVETSYQLSNLSLVRANDTNFALDVFESALQRALTRNEVNKIHSEISLFHVAL